MPEHKKPRVVIPIRPIPSAALAPGEADQLEFRQPPPLSLYVHLPWCVHKCPYCDFNSHEVRGAFPEAEHVQALIADLEAALPHIWGRKVSSLFFGGGTPSLFSGAAIDTLLTAFRTLLPLLPDAEISLEANPGAVEASQFAAFRAAGVNRLSLGIQSFNNAHLKTLGRIHDEYDARRAIEMAARHFNNFNLDLMYGLPGQTLAQAQHDVECALAFAPTHLSCYQLALEPNTAWATAPPTLPEADLCADMQEAIEHRLAAQGFAHYETSAFAQPGQACRHNLNYWTFGDYLGIGAGAHSKLTWHDQIVRQVRWKQPKQYLQKTLQSQAIQEQTAVPANELAFEFMMNALRLNQGFDAALFTMRTSLPLARIEQALQRAEEENLLERSLGRIAPTPKGRRFLNPLLKMFLPD